MRPCIEMSYPEFSGCYALLKDSAVIYVGKSLNVLGRLVQHRNRLRRRQQGKNYVWPGHSSVVFFFDAVRLYPCPSSQLDALERELILLYRPECNVQLPRVGKVIDIVALAKSANIDLTAWRNPEVRRYAPKKAYRRVA